jgi:hypothetical protein
VIKEMMRFDVERRTTVARVDSHRMILKGRIWMERRRGEQERSGGEVFLGSALAGDETGVLETWLAEFVERDA